MQIPRVMVIERIRADQGHDAADRAAAELPEIIDTEHDADALRELKLDPAQLAEEVPGQGPVIS